ncbi:MAG TPA: hypothetical protein VI078_15940 [bacterium]
MSGATVRTAMGTGRNLTQGGGWRGMMVARKRKQGPRAGWRLSALPAALAVVLLCVLPAAAKEIIVFPDTATNYNYVCGGVNDRRTTGVLKESGAACGSVGDLSVPAGAMNWAILYGKLYASSTQVRGKELRVRVETKTGGDLTFKFAHAASGVTPSTITEFPAAQNVTVHLPPSDGVVSHLIDLRGMKGTIPANRRLVFVVDNANSTFVGTVKLELDMRLTYYESVYYVPGDYASISAAIAAPVDSHIFVGDGTWIGAANRSVTFSKALTLLSENGPDRCIVDAQYQAGSFTFNAGATNSTVMEGFTFTHFATAVKVNASAYPIVRNCAFRDNLLADGNLGGAVQVLDGAGAVTTFIEDCLFEGNVASGGGAIGLSNASATQRYLMVRDSVFRGNFAATGGAIALSYSQTTGRVDIERCAFSGNTAENGGAIAAITAGEDDILGCDFQDNRAYDYGGAIYTGKVTGNGIKTVSDSIFRGNSTRYIHGGAIYTDGASVNHCDLIENAAGGGGGGIATTGALYVYNSILRGNTQKDAGAGKEIFADTGGTLNLGYSNVEGGNNSISYKGAASPYTYVGLIDADPQFVAPGVFHLLPTSPCIEAGMDAPPLAAGATVVNEDKDGVKWPQGPDCGAGKPDLGAYGYHGGCGEAVPVIEPMTLLLTARKGGSPPDVATLAIRNASATNLAWSAAADADWITLEPDPASGEVGADAAALGLHVDTSGLEEGVYQANVVVSGQAPSVPAHRTVRVVLHVTRARLVPSEYVNIQSAIDAALSGDEVVVAADTYVSAADKNLNLRGKALHLRSESGPDSTIIDCAGVGRGVTHDFGPPGAILEGFTFRGCSTPGSPNAGYGGGVYVGQYASMEIVNCVFADNHLVASSSDRGGGIYADGVVTVSNCAFSSNIARNQGGGLYLGSNADGSRVIGCRFEGNQSNYGGGLYSTAQDTVVLGCTFLSNTVPYDIAYAYGGGAYLTAYGAYVNGSFFEKNSAVYGGGLYVNNISTTAAPSRVVNSIFYDNSVASTATASWGGGAYAYGSGCKITNCTFYANLHNGGFTGGGAGGLRDANGSPEVRNCIFTGNNAAGASPDTDANNLSYSIVWSNTDNAASHIYGGDLAGSVFVAPTATPPDLRLRTASRAVDTGTTIDDLFSDYRGSVRAIDGREEPVTLQGAQESTSGARFDLGAHEYSDYYGGAAVDGTAKAFKNLRINGKIVATGYEYRIQWDAKDPFPEQMDGRVKQAGEYEARLLLVTDAGRRIELGTWKTALGVGYTVPYTFGAAHVGTWRLRLEMASDPNQFVLSDLFPIQYKALVPYTLGRKIGPPAGAVAGQRPDVNNPAAVYWSTETNELYAIAPYPIQLTWYADKERTTPILVMGIIKTPADPVFHVADAPPVELRPAGTRFSSVAILWSESSAMISSDRFTAPQDGWTTLLFKDSVNPAPEKREFFTVVRTLTWDHQGVTNVTGAPYNGTLGALPPVDPVYPIEKTTGVGALVTDAEHQPNEACSGGYILNEIAPYDGVGDKRAYDRPTRSGQIFAVNDDDPNAVADDLVVIWYRRQGSVTDGAPGVCWPFKPVRYDPAWPAPTTTCVGGQNGACDRIEIASALGSGQLPPDTFGAWDNMIVYNQPDRKLPGFNPNEEHTLLFAAEGTPNPGAFPLRNDMNRFNAGDWAANPVRYTSQPYALVKHRDPVSGEWRFKVFAVTPGNLAYSPEAGNEFNPPYPLNQFVFGPCRDVLPAGVDPADPASPHNGTWSDAVHYAADGSNMATATALKDKDNKLFSIRGGVTVRTYQFYRLHESFWFDLDNNGYPDKPAGTCVPFLGYNPAWTNWNAAWDPAPITYNVIWPPTPTLYVGETLADAKTQAGETEGLPNVKDQCIVAKLWDEAGVRLFDPLKEIRYPDKGTQYPADPDALDPAVVAEVDKLKTDPPVAVGSRVVFLDLPPQLQQRLIYDAVAKKLKLSGQYITTTGEPVLLLNTLSIRELNGIKTALKLEDPQEPKPVLLAALVNVQQRGTANLAGKPSLARWQADFKALSAGNVDNTGFVTLAFNNHPDCAAPTMLSVIEVDCPLYRGDLKVIESPNPFEEKVTLRHNGDFGGLPDMRYFEWVYLQNYSGIPEGPGTPGENWLPFNPANSLPAPTDPSPFPMPDGQNAYRGLVDITPIGTGQQLLPDRWFSVRYRYRDSLNSHADPPDNVPPAACTMISPWTAPQLAEGWVKRVVKKINLFDQKVKDFHKTDADTVANMIAQAGRAYEGDVALSDDPEYLKRLGLIELYETLLNRALALSIDAAPPDVSLRDAVLFAANRLSTLYMLLGNEAYADSADPTVGFGTQDGQYGSMASSMFAFQNQVDALLDEELALLEGRDDAGMRPYYNRLPWNFTIGEGEVAYRQVYNIQDVASVEDPLTPDGEINEYDAKAMFPQGHGDAWGHYLSAIEKLYYLITHDGVAWVPTVEAILVAQAPVEVDYRDERLFANAAAARARAGADLVNLTYRRFYDEDPQKQWQGYRDSNPTRAWGLAEWASRAGQGAYLDWAMGNALLPSNSTTIRKIETYPAPVQPRYVLGADYARGGLEIYVDDALQTSGYTVTLIYDEVQAVHRAQIDFAPVPAATREIVFRVSLPAEGIKKVDRTTVVELREIAAQYDAIQATLDQADAGLNPLGVAKDTVPFDIDPVLVASGQTHFEQIYNRALQSLQNAATVFDYANQSSQMLRRQQDRLDDFKRTVADREADFTSRLVEVFGYPYPEDCGPGKLYATDYCQSGPDLYHYMYVEPSQLMGDANSDQNATTAPRQLDYTVNFRDLTADAAGGLTQTEVPVTFTIDEDRRFGIVKPAAWTGNRRAVGALQLARSDLLQLQGRFERAIIEYDTLIGQVEDQRDLIVAQYGLNAEEIKVIQDANQKVTEINASILEARESAADDRAAAQDAILVANIAMEAFPKVIGMATDAMGAARAIALAVGQGMSLMFNQQADYSQVTELSNQQAKEVAGAEGNVTVTTMRGDFAVKQQILQLENLVRREAVLRQELYTLVEGLQQSAARYLNGLTAGERILEERLRFRKQTAAQVQDYRYTDMTFRVFRNDGLQKYKAQLDLAGRYAYLAAKAYDYETTLLDSSGMAGAAFLKDIVKERSLGTVLGGQPLTGTGLADVLRRLAMNFQVLKPQLGFNNPQIETNRFSLRRELFRVRFDAGSDETWRGALAKYRVDDLWAVPEFRRFCRPFAAPGVAQPGLVIPFRTTVTSGLNFFGWPLGGGDSYYSAANFATKVRSVGVWFSNYNATGLAQTPRVYLVPAGEDVARSPTGDAGDIRAWRVLDQRLPVPQLVNARELSGDRAWIPSVNTILDEFGAPRRQADFKAYHDSGYLEPSELTYDTRLVGRSVWNTKWMLIIPGRSLLYDPGEGLDTFINGPLVLGGTGDRSNNGISDIKLFFTTYAYSGN